MLSTVLAMQEGCRAVRAEVSHSQHPKYGSKSFEGSSSCCGDVLPTCEKGMLQEKMQLVPSLVTCATPETQQFSWPVSQPFQHWRQHYQGLWTGSFGNMRGIMRHKSLDSNVHVREASERKQLHLLC